ncbi:SipW-dependent-type signal peptide-containing protein [Natrarchaeobius sp. A-rgal3]|uniref:SipW-dependent-type signal peptide-containing protein n=1 Tax=Natrarchaeobius versutus TaxID=1679078 RepID=UPI003510141D
MSRDSLQLSRRRLLATVGGIGAIGATAGVGTGAYFTDRERFTNAITAGTVEIGYDCDSCTVVDDRLTFAFDGLDRGTTDSIVIDLTVETNPARLWLRTDCPPAFDPLGDALAVEFDVDGETVADGSLSSVSRSLAAGIRLDDGCLEPGASLETELTWSLSKTAPEQLAGETATFTAELVAEQCRHVDEGDLTNPFTGLESCEDASGCPACVSLGKADDLDERMPIEPSTADRATWLPIDEGPGSGEYFLFVQDAEIKDGAETTAIQFELVDGDGNPGPPLCGVRIKGGPNTNEIEIEPPSTSTGAVLSTLENPGGQRPAISNVEVDVCAEEVGRQ